MKKNLWIALKKNKVWADLYYKGNHIATIKVNEKNRGNLSVLSIDNDDDLFFKIVKDSPLVDDESYYNKEIYNK